jgi:hypothetical protein
MMMMMMMNATGDVFFFTKKKCSIEEGKRLFIRLELVNINANKEYEKRVDA